MKRTQKVFSLMLVFAMVFTLAIPASAASSELREQMIQHFPTLSQGSSGDYVGALQRFLEVHPASCVAMDTAGGIDRSFGVGTSNAVKAFQEYGNESIMSMSKDGIVGDNTWFCVHHELDDDYSDRTIRCGQNGYVWRYNNNNCDIDYLDGIYIPFHTIVVS